MTSNKILTWKAVIGFVCALPAMCSLAQSGNAQLGLTVSMPNGYASVQVDDLTLSSTAGPVRWVRQWDGKEWQFNPHWESLSQSWTNLTGAQTGTPSAGALGAAGDASSGCWVMVDEDWQPQKGMVLIDERPPFPPMLSERTAPFNKLMGENDSDYPPPRIVSVDYASLCKGIPMQNSPVRELEAVRLKNELYMGENGRYAYSNRTFLEKRAVRGLAPQSAAVLALEIAAGTVRATPVDVPKGYRWMDKAGQWIDYNIQGQMIAYGDRNNNTVWLVRDSDGLLRAVVDVHGRVLFSLHYTGKLITEVRDYPVAGMAQDMPARSVQYQYDAGNRLSTVIDVRGNKTRYDYDAANHLVSITDQENRTTKLDYAGYSVKQMVAPDLGVTDYVFEYDDVSKQFSSRITGPETAAGRRVEVQTHNRSGQLLRRLVNGVADEERQYDTGARTQIVTDARGFTSRTTVNEFDQIVKHEREDGSAVANVYSALNLALLEEVDPTGTRTRYERDENGNMIRLVEAFGSSHQRVTDYELDGTGRPIRQIKRGRKEADGTLTVDAVTVMAYDARGNLSSVTEPEGAQTQTFFNRSGKLVVRIDPRKNSAYVQVDAGGLTTQLTDTRNNVWKYKYDKVGNRVSSTDPDLHESTFIYDAADRRTESIEPKGRSLVRYDLQGMPLEMRDSDALGVRFEYDNWQRLIRQTDGAGNVTGFGYQIADGTENGRLGSLDGPTQITYPTYAESRRYDQLGRLTSTILSSVGELERSTQTQYDARGVQRALTDAKGKSTVIESDLFGRPVLILDRLQNKMALNYDVRGNPIAVTDANGAVRRMAYDRSDRLIKETLPMGQFSTMGYDANGNMNVYRDANGNQTSFGHDAGNQVVDIKTVDAEGNVRRVVTNSYDPQGQLAGWTSEEDGKRSAVVIARDEAGRKVSESVTYPDGFVMKYGYSYGPGGKKASLTLPDNSVLTYGYSKHGELATVTVPGEGVMSVSEFNWTAPAETILPGGTVQARQYDGFGNTKSVMASAPDRATLLSMGNTFGVMQEKITSSRVDGHLGTTRAQQYGYDDELRLRKITLDGAAVGAGTETFALDGVANRIAHSTLPGAWQYDGNNRLLQRGTAPASMASYQYDDAGNLVRSTVAGKVTQFRYNSTGRLSMVQDGAGALVARYGYDPLGRRIWKEQYRSRAGTLLARATRTLFLYGDEGLLAEATQTIVLKQDLSVEALSAPTVATLYGPRPDRPFLTGTLFIRTTNSNGGMTTAYYHHDDRQAPVQATDRDGHIVWAADYNAFGRATVITPAASIEVPTLDSRLRLPGQVEDEETGLHYNFQRYYDPETGRYLESDPIGLRGGINTYAYVNHNPLSLIDPEGLDPWYRDPAVRRREAIARTARENKGSEAWSIYKTHPNTERVSRSPFGIGQFKCNLFVDDVMSSAGRSNGRRPDNLPHVAQDWYDGKVPGFTQIDPSLVSNGDVAVKVYPGHSNYSGHVGIVVGPNETASQSSVTDSIVVNDWAFRPEDKGLVRFYRCDCAK
ncbi:MAG TPA: RHS repeat-associated core domain-containing protein [Telluria sp.]|jgi:RHS repeat-associated protein